jgi:hypothetical protein
MDEFVPFRSLIIIAKKRFFKFCYLIRIEDKNCSEVCVLIVRFGLKLIKWDHFQ